MDRLPKDEVDEFFKLKEKLFGDHWDGSSYPDDNPDWCRYQVLMKKIASYMRRKKMSER